VAFRSVHAAHLHDTTQARGGFQAMQIHRAHSTVHAPNMLNTRQQLCQRHVPTNV
jgi:hypothetical protein